LARFTQVPIGTSNPVTLLDGLELLPGVTPARAGIQLSNTAKPVLDTAASVLFLRLKFAVYYQLLLGVVGPAIGFLFDPVTVTTQNQGGQEGQGQVVLDFSGSQTITAQSGLVVGLAFTGGLHLVQEIYLPSSWYSPWKFKWTAVFEKQLTYTVDLCKLLVLLIKYLIGRSRNGAQKGDMRQDPNNTLDKFLNGATSWGLMDEVNGGFPASQALTPTPHLTIPWNMVSYVPLLAQFAKAMQAIKGDLIVGPTVSVLFPTTLRLNRFTVDGGQGLGTTADYGPPLAYTPTTVTGTGPRFTSETPSRLTTRVTYQTQVGVLLSCVFQVSAAKIFSFGVNTPSLDLFRLMRLPQPTLGTINNAVSSQLSDPPVVLVPQLKLSLFNPNGNPAPITAGELTKFDVELRNPWTGPGSLTVNLSNDQNLPGFPSQIVIPVGEFKSSTQYRFPNRAVSTGNPDQPNETQSPTPTSPTYSVRITAQGSPLQVGERAPDFESVQSVKIENPIIKIDPIISEPFQQAKGPVWNPQNGQYVNPNNPGFRNLVPPGFKFAEFRVVWSSTAPTTAVPVRVTLLNEDREPWTSSAVRLSVRGSSTSNVPLRPTATASVGAASFGRWEFRIDWDSIGPNTGFSNRFIVNIDAGADFGQDEVWLYLSEWS
jgi:hypothetical protein